MPIVLDAGKGVSEQNPAIIAFTAGILAATGLRRLASPALGWDRFINTSLVLDAPLAAGFAENAVFLGALQFIKTALLAVRG